MSELDDTARYDPKNPDANPCGEGRMTDSEFGAQLSRVLKGTGGVVVKGGNRQVVVSGSNIASLPAGYTFEEFTICDSGTPATRWLATWASDPS